MLLRKALPPFPPFREFAASMAPGEVSAAPVAPRDPGQASQVATSSSQPPLRTHSRHASKTQRHDVASFDIVATYRRLLSEDPDLTMPVAAVEALIALLGSTRASTSMETVDIIKAQAERLHRSVRNPIPLRAGTDLFQQYILRSLKGQPVGGHSAGTRGSSSNSFEDTRQHLLANSKAFVDRAKAARHEIAARGSRYVLDGSTVLAAGGSRTVRTLLLRAADRHAATLGAPRFRVIYVMDGSRDSGPAVAALRARGVRVATVDPAAMAHVLRSARVDMVFVGTEVVVQNGGLLSRMGTFQLAQLATDMKIPVYVAAETHKIVRVYPLSQSDLGRCGVGQNVLDFRADGDEAVEGAHGDTHETGAKEVPVDYTPPELITSIITEHGVKPPSAIYEMILDIYT